ncbi:MAG: hypothetical protein PF488_01070 [Patescibacteria group bacterium]|jgi:uncharacterized membrane protein YcjF (UPF0283 family)|nr:hypothetical protein [Patescibacteria group bacterium]
MFNKLSSFVLNPEKSKGLGQVYVAQPDLRLEKLAGKVFILTEFSNKKKDGENIFNFLINSLEENYYEDEKVLLREKIEDLKVENLFEAAVTKTNRDFNEFLIENKIKLKNGIDNITIGLVYEDKLYFSNFGKNRALLVYKQKDEYEMINVETNAFDSQDNSLNDKAELKTPKIFSSVISGEIPKNAYFLFTSESLPEFITEEEIINVLSKLPPLAAASQIRNILEQINNYVPFFGLIIKSATELDFSETETENQNNNQSVSSLNQTEQKTEEMLASKGFLNFKKLKNKINEFKQDKLEKEKKEAYKKDIQAKKKQETEDTDEDEKPETLDMVKEDEEENEKEKKVEPKVEPEIEPQKDLDPQIGIVRSLSSIKKDKQLLKEKFSFKKSANKIGSKVSSIFSKIPIPGKRFFSNLGQYFSKKYSKKNTAIVGFSLILIVGILAVSIAVTTKNKRIEQLSQRYTNLTNEISEKQTSIESDLLYDNYDKASETLEEMRKLVSDFPQETEQEKEYYQELTAEIEETQETIYKINRLEETNLVLDLSDKNIEDISSFNERIIALSNTGYYVLNTNEEINKDELELNNLDNNYTKFNPQFDQENNNLYFLNNTNLSKLNVEDNSIETYTVDPELDNGAINFETYSSRDKLYLLNPKENQILTRDKRTGNTYPETENWLKDDINLANASDILIDGDIYILFNNGKIEKFRIGEKQEYREVNIKPSSNGFNEIVEKDGYFYIFDKNEKKLVVIKKSDGALMGQYIFENLNNPTDFSLGTGGNVFVLDGGKIYEFSI